MGGVKSFNINQQEILKDIVELHLDNERYDCDLTYGNGSFWTGMKKPEYCLDIEPLSDDVIESCSMATPFNDSQLTSLVFDPPFLTYIKSGREHNSIMGRRFSGYWRYDELEHHYKNTLREAERILKPKGIMVFKCQDIIHNHKMHCTHCNVINWAAEFNLILKDLFILPAKNRMPINTGKKRKQRHARIWHSYFLVLQNHGKK